MYPAEKLLLKVIGDLSDFLPYLVLVGGWIPYVYAKYIWLDVPEMAVITTDIDFGVVIKEFEGSESIASRIRKLDYGERHISMDRMIPFVPVVKGTSESEKAEVEFLTATKAPEYIKEKLVGKEIKINEIKYFDILLESSVTVTMAGCEVQIPKDSLFVFHKLLTFVQRGNEDRLRKDLYYSYYMLRFCPEKDRLMKEINSLIKLKKEGKKVDSNINRYFKHIDSKGPVLVERENGPDDFISNIRKDVYERFTKLLVKQ